MHMKNNNIIDASEVKDPLQGFPRACRCSRIIQLQLSRPILELVSIMQLHLPSILRINRRR